MGIFDDIGSRDYWKDHFKRGEVHPWNYGGGDSMRKYGEGGGGGSGPGGRPGNMTDAQFELYRNQGEEGDWHEGQMDEFGYLPFIPDPAFALNAQLRAERLTERRNQMIVDKAMGFQREGLSNLQTYRPGGAAALTSGYYSNLSNLYMQKQTDAPDLLADWREKKQRDAEARADKAAKKSREFSLLMPIGNAGLAGAQQAQVSETTAGEFGKQQVEAGTGSAQPAAAGAPAAAPGAEAAAARGEGGAGAPAPANAGGEAGAPGGGEGAGGGGGGPGTGVSKLGGPGAGGGAAGGGVAGPGPNAATGAGGGAGVGTAAGGMPAAGSGMLATQVPAEAGGLGQVAGGGSWLAGPIGAILGAVLQSGGRSVSDMYGALAYTAEGAADAFGVETGRSSSVAANETAAATAVGGMPFIDRAHQGIDAHLASLDSIGAEFSELGQRQYA